MFPKIFKQMLRHKFMTVIILLLIIIGGYFGYKNFIKEGDAVSYITTAPQRGMLIVSTSGSGQVSASNQVDIKSKVSGEVVYVGAKNGQEVRVGALLAQVDSSNAQKSVRDAETSLETAKLELEELLQPLDELTLLQAENSLIQLKESKQKAEDNLVKSYEDGFNALVNAFFDLPTIMIETEDILYGNDINKNQDNIAAYADLIRAYEETQVTRYKNIAANSYYAARLSYNTNFQNYKIISRYSENAVIETLVDETYEAAKKIAETLKDTDNLISFVKDALTQREASAPSVTASHQSSIKTNTSKINSILSSLLSIKTAIKSNRDSIVSAERSIVEKELSVAKLKAGPDELTLRAKNISIQQKEDALLAAQQNLADYYIRAPFDGIIADVSAKKVETISSSAIATLITKQKIATITLNEIDAAKIKVGQKSNITFDAVEDLNITGEVVEVDTLGAITQGVVSYDVKIAFDLQDDRVKPGMTMSATIIIESKPDVLLVPLGALKIQGDVSYVEKIIDGQPQRQVVTVGSSNDTLIEIISGLEEGDSVITQTINSQNATTQNSGFQGGPSGGNVMMEGGMMRMMR